MAGPKGGRGKRAKEEPGQPISIEEWLAGANKHKWATRDMVVAFSQYQLRTQIMPLIGESIRAYDTAIKNKKWYRRLWRLVKSLFLRDRVTVKDLPDDARAELRAELDAADAVEEESKEIPEPARTCVVCGSAQLEPISEAGGLQCDKGHVVEEPPLQFPEEVADG